VQKGEAIIAKRGVEASTTKKKATNEKSKNNKCKKDK
jgi:hypothetical protein